MLTPDLDEALREFAIRTPPRPRGVLLVDDELENLESLAALLEDDYEVRTASSGDAALKILASGAAIDVIIADQRMPGMTGVELHARIAADSPDTIRIVLTAYDDVGPMMAAINRGAVFRFLLKPCAPEELRSVVAEGITLTHATNMLRQFIQASTERQESLDRAVKRLTRTQDYLLGAERLTTAGRAASGILHNVRNLSTLTSILVGEIQACAPNAAALASGRSAVQGFVSLVQLLESIRDFTRIADTRLDLCSTEMVPFLEQVVSYVGLQERGAKCRIEIDVDRATSRLVLDRIRTRQALAAVLHNAIRASQPGATVTIRVYPTRERPPKAEDYEADWVAVDVRDEGIGMDSSTLENATVPLFSGFSPPGVGLGLSAARLVAEIHGGGLLLESSLGKGTRVSLLLPREPFAFG